MARHSNGCKGLPFQLNERLLCPQSWGQSPLLAWLRLSQCGTTGWVSSYPVLLPSQERYQTCTAIWSLSPGPITPLICLSQTLFCPQDFASQRTTQHSLISSFSCLILNREPLPMALEYFHKHHLHFMDSLYESIECPQLFAIINNIMTTILVQILYMILRFFSLEGILQSVISSLNLLNCAKQIFKRTVWTYGLTGVFPVNWNLMLFKMAQQITLSITLCSHSWFLITAVLVFMGFPRRLRKPLTSSSPFLKSSLWKQNNQPSEVVLSLFSSYLMTACL